MLDPANLTAELQKIKPGAETIHPAYERNAEYFFQSILPGYLQWCMLYIDNTKRKHLIQPIGNISKGHIVFKKHLGFTVLKHVRKEGQLFKLHLSSPGFEWYGDDEDYLLMDHPSSEGVIIYGRL